jgi:hypothetical protein
MDPEMFHRFLLFLIMSWVSLFKSKALYVSIFNIIFLYLISVVYPYLIYLHICCTFKLWPLPSFRAPIRPLWAALFWRWPCRWKIFEKMCESRAMFENTPKKGSPWSQKRFRIPKKQHDVSGYIRWVFWLLLQCCISIWQIVNSILTSKLILNDYPDYGLRVYGLLLVPKLNGFVCLPRGYIDVCFRVLLVIPKWSGTTSKAFILGSPVPMNTFTEEPQNEPILDPCLYFNS